MLEEKLRDTHTQIEALKRSNKVLEEQLQLMENGKFVEKRRTAMRKRGDEKCVVLGDSILRDVGAGNQI